MAFLPLAGEGGWRDDGGMKIEILLFDGFDDLDAFGPFEVLTGSGLETRFVTVEPQDVVVSNGGARIVPHGVLGDPDLVLVPGGGWNDRGAQGAYAEARKGVITRSARAPARRGRADRLGLHRRDAARRGRPAHRPPRDHASQRDRGPARASART